MNYQELEAKIIKECEPCDAVDGCRKLLNGMYSFDKVGGPFVGMSPATVLHDIDPICWQIELNTFCQVHGFIKVGSQYYCTEDVADKIEELSNDIDVDISNLRVSQRYAPQEFDTLAVKIANLQQNKEELYNYLK